MFVKKTDSSYDITNQDQYQDQTLNRKRPKSINYSNHHIYLPPPPTLLTNTITNQTEYKPNVNEIIENSNNSIAGSLQMTTLLQGTVCNCINIASCNKEEINGFIHSKDCILNRM